MGLSNGVNKKARELGAVLDINTKIKNRQGELALTGELAQVVKMSQPAGSADPALTDLADKMAVLSGQLALIGPV